MQINTAAGAYPGKYRLPSSASGRLLETGYLLAGAFSFILASPKWGLGFFAWTGPLFLLAFSRTSRLPGKWFWFFTAATLSSLVSSYQVAPFPSPVLLAFSLLEGAKISFVYWADLRIIGRNPRFPATFFFPAACVSIEFINAAVGGVWWSAANTQLSFSWLAQLASVTGIWGISFIIYWFGSVALWHLQSLCRPHVGRKGIIAFALVLALILAYGAIRSTEGGPRNQQWIKVAGVSVPMVRFMEDLYQDYTGKRVQIDPKSSITSTDLQRINAAQLPFVETADSLKFKAGYAALHVNIDSLFALSKLAADSGARIITWSEANAIVFDLDAWPLIRRGSAFAREARVYLLMAMAVIHPGKITPGRKFLENQAVFIGPDGRVLNIFHKNHPVPMAEASVPGDGNIPVIQTPYGSIAISICYDADFPQPMRQLSAKRADLLLLPSADWYAIDPFHTQMAAFRGIENGTTVFRQTNGGLSAAFDQQGKMLSSFDFFQPGKKWWTANLPLGNQPTIYGRLGDGFAYLCVGIVIYWTLIIVWGSFGRRKAIHQELRAKHLDS